MNARGNGVERRVLQAVVSVLCIVPIGAGAAGVVLGPGLVGTDAPDADLDSHFRYLSGLLLAIGLTFLSTVPEIERRTRRFRLAAALVFCGGLARGLSLLASGEPTLPHLVGLGLELIATPLLVLWQARLAGRPVAA
ncbi:DUF4345 domain-containing protein [Arenibaculum sp.]|jgi:hypothetical protein|uniref:DUF4345 domain-containing protein n=1 Tax=Arenibaculum sp. TaxID=2865862 RepID=UPI002E1401A2|nr:DUF4345 domain-containing protein [Arenibaculum sp.]